MAALIHIIAECLPPGATEGVAAPRSDEAAFPGAAEMRKEHIMSTNRIEGIAKQASGSIKQTAGKLVGNEKLQVEGAVEKAVGKAQNAVGKAQDEIANQLKK